MQKRFILPTLMLAALLALAACAPLPVNAPNPTSPPSDPVGTPKPDGPSAARVEKTLYVGPELVECEGAHPQMCMLVKENPENDYGLFYSQIEGFEFEPGYEYTLRVMVEQVENPPADASSLKYTLIEVVDKQPVAAAENAPLEGALWRADAILSPDGDLVPSLPETKVTALFIDGNVGGNNSCNNYNAAYTVDGNNIEIGLGMSTMMACPEPISTQEGAYMAALPSAATFAISGKQMEMFDADGNVVLQFSVLEPTPLTGTTWQATGYNNGKQAIVSVVIDTEITAMFSEDGQLSGSTGCNNYNSTYEVDGDAMQIGPVATTRMMCPDEVMQQEMDYLAALGQVASYSIAADELTLYNAEGTRYAIYRALPAE